MKRARKPLTLNFKVSNFSCSLYDLVLISVSDASYGVYGAMPGGGSQDGNLVMLARPEVLTGNGPVCVWEGNSTNVQRVVRCSMSADTSSLATAYEHGDFVCAVLVEQLDADFDVNRWKLCVQVASCLGYGR